MPTHHKISKPYPSPKTWSNFYEATRMTVPAFQCFREMVDRIARKHLVLDLTLVHQDKRLVQRCLAEISKGWPYEGCYDDDWPLQMCLQRVLAYKSSHHRGDAPWNPRIPEYSEEPPKTERPGAERKPAIRPNERRDSARPGSTLSQRRVYASQRRSIRPLAVLNQGRNTPSPSESPLPDRAALTPQPSFHASPGTSAGSTVYASSNMIAPSGASTPQLRSRTPSARGTSLSTTRPIRLARLPSRPPANAQPLRTHPRPTTDTYAVHAWFAAIDPPLPSAYAVQLVALGIVNADRLRALACHPRRDHWLNEYLPDLDRYEYFVLRCAFDQLCPAGAPVEGQNGRGVRRI